ncbi:unnamed protein product [Symbiodinium sp. CCMP2456]|nr:unnamed protein product [Symbiodinium sp. CCMP2456]
MLRGDKERRARPLLELTLRAVWVDVVMWFCLQGLQHDISAQGRYVARGGLSGVVLARDKDFVEYDAAGKPTIAMCFNCADLGGRLRPDLAALGVQGAKTMLSRYRAGTGCLEDPSFKKDFLAAARFQDRSDGPLRAPFMPGSAVKNVTSYGIRVSHVYACLTEAEYAALLGAPPSAIKLAPTSLPVLGPGQSRNYYVLDMEGLPEALKSTCKKLEIFYNAESEFDQIYLDGTTQIHQDQGEHVFNYIAKTAFQNRPEKSRPASMPMTLEEAFLKHQEAAAAQAAAGEAPGSAAVVDADDDDEVAPRENRSFGIVAAAAPKPGAKAGAKRKAAAAAVAADAAARPRRVSGSGAEPSQASNVGSQPGGNVTSVDEEMPVSESSVPGGKAGQLARLDPDMRLVAEKHWLNHPSAAVKSLESLSAIKYLLDPTKPLTLALNGVSPSRPYPLGNITPRSDARLQDSAHMGCSAKRLLETLQKDKQLLAVNLLQNRVDICEQAMNFANANLLNTSVQTLNQLLNQIKSLWNKIPVPKQVTIAQRFAIEALGTAIELYQKGSAEWQSHRDLFLEYFRWPVHTECPTEAPEFNAKEAKFAGILDQLLCMAGDREDEDLLAGFNDEGDEVENAKANAKAAKDAGGGADGSVADLQEGAQAGALREFPAPVAAAIEKAMLEIFLSESWLRLLEAAQENKAFIVSIAAGFLDLQEQQKALSDFLAQTPLSNIPAVCEQISRFCKACLLAFGENPTEGKISCSVKDLFWFSEYTGPNLYERSMRNIMSKNEWWAKQLTDVARTASSKPLLEPARLQLEDLLEKDANPASTKDLQAMAELFTQVTPALRDAEVEKLSASIVERTKAAAVALREVTDLSSIEKIRVDVILKLLTLFGHVPGVASVQEEFVKWATASQTTLQRNGFLAALWAATATETDFVPVKTALENQPGPMLAPIRKSPDLLGATIHFLRRGCQSIIHKALLGTQTSTESKHKAYTMILLFKTVFSDADVKLLKSLATTQCSGLAICSAAHAALQKLIQSGDDAEKRLAQDPDLILVTNVQQQRLKQKGYVQDLQKVQAQIRSAEADVATLLGNNDSFIHSLGCFAEYDMSAAFQEHSSEAINFETIFQDCLELRGAHLAKKLQDSGDEVVASCQGWQQGGLHFWRQAATPEASVSELQDLMKKSILALSPKDIKRTTDNFIQVMTDARAFLDKFELKQTKLHDVLEDVIEGPREVKVLYMESLLLRQFYKLAEEPANPEHVKDMKALVTKHGIFCTSNVLKISSADLHPGLWTAAQAACN